jgi:hypothetical protein
MEMDIEILSGIRRWFSLYSRSFDCGDKEAGRNMALKEEHTFRVSSNIVEIGRREGLNSCELMTAEAIAMLHDVGRFEQYRRFGTFRDADSVDHAELGARIITEQGLIAPLPPAEQAAISLSVRHHNAFAVPASLPENTRFFLKLIRDADKLDIWRVFIEYFALPPEERASAAGLGLPDRPECSSPVLDQIENGEMVRLSTVKTLNDFKLMQLSWIYDLNFSGSMALVSERGCVDRLAATLPGDNRVEMAVQVIRELVKTVLLKSNSGSV